MKIYRLLKSILLSTFYLVFILYITGCSDSYSKYSSVEEKQSAKRFIEITSINNNLGYNLDYYLGSGLTLVNNGYEGTEKRYGCIDSKGNIVIPIEYKIINKFNDNISFVMDLNNECKYINNVGVVICEEINGARIISGTNFDNGYANVTLNYRKGSYIIDENGNVILEPTSKSYNYTIAGNSAFNVFKNDAYVCTVDATGKLIKGLENPFYSDENFNIGFYYDEVLGLYGFINVKNYTKLSEPIIEKFSFFEYDTTLCTINGELLLINSSLDVIENLSLMYTGVDAYYYKGFSEKIATLTFTDSSRTIIINNLGTLVADTDFDFIYDFYDGLAVYEKDGKFGYIRVDGEVILPPEYDIVTGFANGTGFIQSEGYTYKVSKSNN